jgi:cytochrome c biogenesis protein CcdA
MLRTLSIVVSIALADSINVTTIAPALALAAGEHPRRSVFEFSLGIIVVFFLGGVLLVLGPGRALLALVPHPSATTRYIAETVAGVAMLGLAVWLWTRRDPTRDAGESASRGAGEAAGSRRRKSPFLMGAAIALAELPTAFPYFAAIGTIVSARLGIWRELLLVAVYDVCFVMPLFGIILVLTVGGERATGILARIRTQFQAHWREVAAAAALVAGVYVTALGVTGLASSSSGRVGRVSRRLRRIISR